MFPSAEIDKQPPSQLYRQAGRQGEKVVKLSRGYGSVRFHTGMLFLVINFGKLRNLENTWCWNLLGSLVLTGTTLP